MVDVDVDEPVPDVCVTVGEGDPVSVSSMAKVTASDWRTAPCRFGQAPDLDFGATQPRLARRGRQRPLGQVRGDPVDPRVGGAVAGRVAEALGVRRDDVAPALAAAAVTVLLMSWARPARYSMSVPTKGYASLWISDS